MSDTFLIPQAFSYAAEASWSLGDFGALQKLLSEVPEYALDGFNIGVGRALIAIRNDDRDALSTTMSSLREEIVRSFSPATTASFKAYHEQLLRLHALYEIEKIAGPSSPPENYKETVLDMLDSRLRILGALTADKQYLLGIRRAAMSLSRYLMQQFPSSVADI